MHRNPQTNTAVNRRGGSKINCWKHVQELFCLLLQTRGSKKSNAPKVHYVNNHHGITISIPSGIQFPFTAEKAM